MIQRKIFFYAFGYMLINVFLLMFACIFCACLEIVEWISFIQIVLSVLVVTKINKDALSFYNVFVTLIYLFNFGQAIIRIFGFNDSMVERGVLAKVSETSLIQAELFAMLSIFAITIGYVFSNNRASMMGRAATFEFSDIEVFRLKKIACSMLIISVVPMAYIDIQKIFALSAGSYEDSYLVYQQGIGKYVGIIGQFGKPTLSLLILLYHTDKRKATLIFLLVNIYLMVMMISGDRGTQLIYIITNVLIYAKFVKKPRFRTVFCGIVIGYFALGFLSTLSLLRYGDLTLKNFFEFFALRKEQGILYNSLREFGGSVLSLVHSIDYIPEYSSFNYGLTYLESILYISPVLPGFLSDAMLAGVSFIHAFPTSAVDYISLGGNCLGELFFNFGWFGPFFALFIGSLIKRIDNGLNRSVNLRIVAVIIVLLPSLILWVRDFYVNMIFKTFWYAILIVLTKWGKNGKSIDNNNG